MNWVLEKNSDSIETEGGRDLPGGQSRCEVKFETSA